MEGKQGTGCILGEQNNLWRIKVGIHYTTLDRIESILIWKSAQESVSVQGLTDSTGKCV